LTSAAPDRPSTSPRPRIEHLPALDGLRGACLVAVLLFHSGFAWMSGGFLGVSTFFTLSGFLITTLLLAERGATGTVSLRGFWERRLRRLLPASLLTIAAIVATAPLWLEPSQREHLAEDALATLFYAVNWRFMSPAYAYNLIFTDPSPLQHFWSLAIEGQFYVVFPLLVALLLRAGGGPRALAAVCVLATAASIGVALAAPSLEAAQHRLYYGTDARAGELLIGALLALLRERGVGARSLAARRTLHVAGTVAALLLVAAWCLASVGDAWLYRGGFALYAACSALVVAAATRPDGPVYRVLSLGWLRWIGTVSYGAYLFHWPLFLFLTPARTGLSPLPLLVLRGAATLGLAALSYRLVELPIRRSSAVPPRRFVRAAVAGVAVVLALIIWSNPLAMVVHVLSQVNAVRGAMRGDPWKLRVGTFGDSTAVSLARALEPWLGERADTMAVNGRIEFGCGVLETGEIENRGQWQPQRIVCRDFLASWTTAARNHRVQVAIVLVGPWEVRTRRAHPKAPPRALGDPELDAQTRAAITRAVDNLASSGAVVVWLTAPHVDVRPHEDGESFASDRAASEPRRMDRLNEIIREVATSRPETMRVVDLAGYVAGRPGGEFDPALRADGVHLTTSGAHDVVRAWLGEAILRAAHELRTGQAPGATPEVRSGGDQRPGAR